MGSLDPLASNNFISNRIFENIFIGSAAAAADGDFLFANAVTVVINCAPSVVPNYYEDSTICYFSLDDTDLCGSAQRLGAFAALDHVRETGDHALIHSRDGASRAVIVAAAYLVYRYLWPPARALQFIASRRTSVHLLHQHNMQLLKWATPLRTRAGGYRDVFGRLDGMKLEPEEWVLRNCALNALRDQPPPPPLLYRPPLREVAIQHPEVVSCDQQILPATFRWIDSTSGSLERPPTPGYSTTGTQPVLSVPRTVSRHFVPERPPSPLPPASLPAVTAVLVAETPLPPPVSILKAVHPGKVSGVVVQPLQAAAAAEGRSGGSGRTPRPQVASPVAPLAARPREATKSPIVRTPTPPRPNSPIQSQPKR